MHSIRIFPGLSIAILLFVTACRTVPVHDVNSALFAVKLTKEQARLAIIHAGDQYGWKIEDDGPGRVIATLTLRKHYAAVYITYDERFYSISYKESRHLRYNGTRIHKNYNSWISNLSKAIKLHARQATELVAASAPAAANPPKAAVSTGTGFFVNQAGHAITNAHVIEGCKKLDVTTPGGFVIRAFVVAEDKLNDLAALKVNTRPDSWAHFRSGSLARAGDQAVAFGFPLSGALSSRGNVTTGNISALSGVGDDIRFYQMSTPVQPGNSGGPLMDNNGNVIGIVTAKIDAILVAQYTGDIPQNVNFALKGSLARAFLDSNGISYASRETEKELSTADIAEGAQAFSVRVNCSP